MKKVITGIVLTCITVVASAICFNTANAQLDTSQGEPTIGQRCMSCNGTGWSGNLRCIQCKGTGANSSY